MIKKIISLSVRHCWFVLCLNAAAAIVGYYCYKSLPLDFLPDVEDPQVIVYSKWERSPELLEQHVTSPLVKSFLGLPHIKNVRAQSDYGYSFIYIIFEPGIDLYWARTQVAEALSMAAAKLPDDVTTELGPAATGLGWIYQYVVKDTAGKHSSQELKALQDWYIKDQFKSIPGVADVASVGGEVKQYQIIIDPTHLQRYNLNIDDVVTAVRQGSTEVGGGIIDVAGTEIMIRGKGYAESTQDFENVPVATQQNGPTVRIKDLGNVLIGKEPTRGITDLSGKGEVVSGIIIMRQRENALEVITNIKNKVHFINKTLPPGVSISPVYDRSILVEETLSNLKRTVIEITLVVALTIVMFLAFSSSALIPIISIPLTALIAFIPLKLFNISLNILSLGGIAIAIGAIVDASIVIVEQVQYKLETSVDCQTPSEKRKYILQAVNEVAPASFWALVVIAISFVPIAVLDGPEGRIFKPMAIAKTLTMLVAACLTITLDPALRIMFSGNREAHQDPSFARLLKAIVGVKRLAKTRKPAVLSWIELAYQRILCKVLQNGKKVILAAGVVIILTIPVALQLKTELLPPIEEGAFLYMPSTAASISAAQSQKVLQATSKILMQFPEVLYVFGKAGRAEAALDPAPLSMIESIVVLKPKAEWRRRPSWYASWAPETLCRLIRFVVPDHISEEELKTEMNAALSIPGVFNGWTMPVRGRLDMVETGLNTPLGLKVLGPTFDSVQLAVQKTLSQLEKRPEVVRAFSEQQTSGSYLDVDWDREKLSYLGISLEEAQSIVKHAIGGETVGSVYKGQERYSVNVRYIAEARSSPSEIGKIVLASKQSMVRVPISQVASIKYRLGPTSVRNENGQIAGYILLDIGKEDPVEFVRKVGRSLENSTSSIPNVSLMWSGNYEGMERVRAQLKSVLVIVIAIIALIVFVNVKSISKVLIVLLSVPFSAVGAIWILFVLGYKMSLGVWVGIIALLGVDAQMGIFMLLYLDLAFVKAQKDGVLKNVDKLHDVIMEGAAHRLRPKMMTVSAMLIGLTPVLWSNGLGAGFMKRVAAPLVGGIVVSFVLELLIYPLIYYYWRKKTLLT